MIATQLDRIVGNLVDNAYAYGKPPVCIATSRTPDGFLLVVEDQGDGIPEDDKERATLPFVRLDPARGGNAHSGLGLAIVDRLVRQAGGKLNLVNADGGGFRVEMLFGAATV
jgi:two-component system osmolarity sensor histidine kinase EnvZ